MPYIFTATLILITVAIIYFEYSKKNQTIVENTITFDFDEMYSHMLVKNINNMHYIFQCEVVNSYDLTRHIVNIHLNSNSHDILVFLNQKPVNLTIDSQNFVKSVLLFDLEHKNCGSNPCSTCNTDILINEMNDLIEISKL